MVKKAHTHCDDCGRAMQSAHRVEGQYAYCATCYAREFKPAPCVVCGEMARVHRNDDQPVCRSCKMKSRRCIRCDRPVERAGLLVEGKAVCASCAPHFRKKATCEMCGQPSARLSRISNGDPRLACEACRRSTNITCYVCHRHRKLYKTDNRGHKYCRDCGGKNPITHDCPDCGKTTPGGGKSACTACALQRRINHRIHLNTELLENTWCRDLFRGFFRWSGLRQSAGNMTQRIDHYARFFHILDIKMANVDVISQGSLIEVFGVEALRRWYLPLMYIVESCQIQWDPVVLEELNEMRRVQAMISQVTSTQWRKLLTKYYDYLRDPDEKRKKLKMLTIRQYLHTANVLLSGVDSDSVTSIQNQHVKKLLHKTPGARASIFPFVEFLETEYELSLARPDGKKRNARKYEKWIIESIRNNLRRIDASSNPGELRALIIDTISKLYGVPRKETLSLQWRDVSLSNHKVVLFIKDRQIILDKELVKPFRSMMSVHQYRKGYVFQGRNTLQPMSGASVAYHLTTGE